MDTLKITPEMKRAAGELAENYHYWASAKSTGDIYGEGDKRQDKHYRLCQKLKDETYKANKDGEYLKNVAQTTKVERRDDEDWRAYADRRDAAQKADQRKLDAFDKQMDDLITEMGIAWVGRDNYLSSQLDRERLYGHNHHIGRAVINSFLSGTGQSAEMT